MDANIDALHDIADGMSADDYSEKAECIRDAIAEIERLRAQNVGGDVGCAEGDDAELDRILSMSEDELRAELVAEGRDPDQVVQTIKLELKIAILRVAVENAIAWHAEQAEALSKKPSDRSSTWRMLEHDEQANRLRNALDPNWRNAASEECGAECGINPASADNLEAPQ